MYHRLNTRKAQLPTPVLWPQKLVRRSRQGFTLVELLVSLLVMGLLVLLVLWSLQRLQHCRKEIAAWSQTMDEARYLLRLIEGDLRNVYRGNGESGDDYKFMVRPTDAANTVGPVFWITQPSYRLTPVDIAQVRYILSPARPGETMRLFTRLYQSEESPASSPTPSDEQIQMWVTLNDLSFSYFDGNVWQKSWPAEAACPHAVKVELMYGEETLSGHGRRLAKTIYLRPLGNLVEYEHE